MEPSKQTDLPTTLKLVTQSNEFIEKYWDGRVNMLARFWAYYERGLSLANQGKYVIGIFGLGIFKSDLVVEGWMLIVSGLLQFPILALMGRWHIYRVSKAVQVMTSRHEALLGFNGYNLQIYQAAVVAAMAEKMGIDVKKLEKKLIADARK